MAEREWAGRWAGGSLPNDINNILYWVATAGRGRQRGRGNRVKEQGVRRKKGNGGEKNLGESKRQCVEGRGVMLSGDSARRKIRKRSRDRRQRENKQNRIIREGLSLHK